MTYSLLFHLLQVYHTTASVQIGDTDTAGGTIAASATRYSAAIAVNADSLATWFLPALAPLLEQHPIELNLLVDDECRTLDRVREGQAFGAVSLHGQPLAGCCVDELGEMRYLLTASPAFVARHFPNGLTAAALAKVAG